MTPGYDAQKAHDYYERHKRLKGRHPGTAKTISKAGGAKARPTGAPKTAAAKSQKAAAQARTVRLTQKLHKLQAALKEAQDALNKQRHDAVKSRATAKKTAKKNSDGKTTAKERQQAKEYRQKHKAELASKAKKAGSGGGSKKAVSEMNQTELKSRISTIKSAISSAKQQIQKANSLSHSMFVNDLDHLAHHDGAKAVDTYQEGDSQNGSRF